MQIEDGGVDCRCPANESKLFFRVVAEVIEVACADCRQKARRDDPAVMLVLHRYSFAGDFIDTRTLSGVRHRRRSKAAPATAGE